MEESGQQQRFLRRSEEPEAEDGEGRGGGVGVGGGVGGGGGGSGESPHHRGGGGRLRHDDGGGNVGHYGMMREESSEVTAVEGHSDMLFDAATYASEGHLMDRYRNRLGPIFEDVLRNVRDGFVAGYKVRCLREGRDNYHHF